MKQVCIFSINYFSVNIPFGYSSEKMQKFEARVDKIQ